MLVDAISHLQNVTQSQTGVCCVTATFCTPLSVSYLPGDCEVVLSLAAGSDDQVSLVQGLHHFLCLVETDIVEVGVGDHTLYICWRQREIKEMTNRIRTVMWK